MDRPTRIEPGPGQESVWDYPRPPRIEPSNALVTVHCNSVVVARTTKAVRVLETSHPPVFYIPLGDVLADALQPSARRPTVCEYKGVAVYFNVVTVGSMERDAAWSYLRPAKGYEAITDHVAFYPELMDSCAVDGEVVRPQPGGFYGGWITESVVGPFRTGPHTYGQ